MVFKRGWGSGQNVPTIHDVARVANVSLGTVSKALNDKGNMRDETRARIAAIAAEIGYRPNELARSLRRSRSLTVGLITTDFLGRFSFPIVEAIEQRFAQDNIAVFMCNATNDPERERKHIEQLLGKRVDAFIVTADRADLRPSIAGLTADTPTLYVYSRADDPDALCFIADDEGGARLAVEHLIAQGRRRIAYVAGPMSYEASRLRQIGYRKCLADAGLTAKRELQMTGPWSQMWGRDAVVRMFDRGAEYPDAIFCGNDQIARGVADALRERMIIVPDDVAIVGFDNWEVMTLEGTPKLSSVDMNLRSLGWQAAEALLAA